MPGRGLPYSGSKGMMKRDQVRGVAGCNSNPRGVREVPTTNNRSLLGVQQEETP